MLFCSECRQRFEPDGEEEEIIEVQKGKEKVTGLICGPCVRGLLFKKTFEDDLQKGHRHSTDASQREW
jgi:hypothetical protein